MLRSVRNDSIPYRKLFDALVEKVPVAELMVVTSLPRVGLQIVQPQKLGDDAIKAYSRELYLEDQLFWRAVLTGQPIRGSDVFETDHTGAEPDNRFWRELLRPRGFHHVAVAPLAGPVFDGYPGALYAMRNAQDSDFTDEGLRELAELASQIDEAATALRRSRVPKNCERAQVWGHTAPNRKFVFDDKLRLVYPGSKDALDTFDSTLRGNLAQHVQQRMDALVHEKKTANDRVQLPDAGGDLWTFRFVSHDSYPALGDGKFMVVTLQPEWCDWTTIRANDFQPDLEVYRLVPAMKFMQNEFHRGPTLGEIAKTVHLSPFHFHRRFTELLGITPKHFLLECQLFEAKSQLLAREKDLAKIAADTGFAHQSHFTSRFRQATGLTPTKWRKLYSQKAHSSK